MQKNREEEKTAYFGYTKAWLGCFGCAYPSREQKMIPNKTKPLKICIINRHILYTLVQNEEEWKRLRVYVRLNKINKFAKVACNNRVYPNQCGISVRRKTSRLVAPSQTAHVHKFYCAVNKIYTTIVKLSEIYRARRTTTKTEDKKKKIKQTMEIICFIAAANKIIIMPKEYLKSPT